MEKIIADLRDCANLLMKTADELSKLNDEKFKSLVDNAFKDGYGTALSNMKTTLQMANVVGPIDDHHEPEVIEDPNFEPEMYQAFLHGLTDEELLKQVEKAIALSYPENLKDGNTILQNQIGTVSVDTDWKLCHPADAYKTFENVHWIYNPCTSWVDLYVFANKMKKWLKESLFLDTVNIEVVRIL